MRWIPNKLWFQCGRNVRMDELSTLRLGGRHTGGDRGRGRWNRWWGWCKLRAHAHTHTRAHVEGVSERRRRRGGGLIWRYSLSGLGCRCRYDGVRGRGCHGGGLGVKVVLGLSAMGVGPLTASYLPGKFRTFNVSSLLSAVSHSST
jgi:hypothetical protein